MVCKTGPNSINGINESVVHTWLLTGTKSAIVTSRPWLNEVIPAKLTVSHVEVKIPCQMDPCSAPQMSSDKLHGHRL